jgi:hypothetical protein
LIDGKTALRTARAIRYVRLLVRPESYTNIVAKDADHGLLLISQVIVGRCSDTDPDTWVPIHTWVIEPRTESEEVDQFYALDWTIDPFTLQPLILVGGVQALVYVLDCGTLGIRRILRGHGGVSYCCWV